MMCIEDGEVYELPNSDKLLAVVTKEGAIWLLPEVHGGVIYSVDAGGLTKYSGFGLAAFRSSQIVGMNWERSQYTVDDLRPVQVAKISLYDVCAEEMNKLPYLGGDRTSWPIY